MPDVSPSYLTIDPLTGAVDADITGVISARGLRLTPGQAGAKLFENSVEWDDADGIPVARLTGYNPQADVGSLSIEAAPVKDVNDPYTKGYAIDLNGNNGSSNDGILLRGTSQISGALWSRVLAESIPNPAAPAFTTVKSDFLQLAKHTTGALATDQIRIDGYYTIPFGPAPANFAGQIGTLPYLGGTAIPFGSIQDQANASQGSWGYGFSGNNILIYYVSHSAGTSQGWWNGVVLYFDTDA